MRAALFGGPRSITVGERPDPVISAPTDAMVRGNHHLLFSHWCARPPSWCRSICFSSEAERASDTPDRIGREILHTYHP